MRFLEDCEKGGEERMDVLGLDEDLLCGDTMLPSVNVGFNELQEDFGGDQALKSIYSTAKSSPLPSPGVWGRS